MEQAFEMVENLTEELTEKEERLMKLEKQLEESEKKNKELFDFKEIVDICRESLFNCPELEACELQDYIWTNIGWAINKCWSDKIPEKTEDGLPLSVYHKLMPIAIEEVYKTARFDYPTYVTRAPMEPFKHFQKEAFLTIDEVVEKVFERLEEINECLEEDGKPIITQFQGRTFDEDNINEVIEHIEEVDDNIGWCEVVKCFFKRNGKDMFLLIEN